MLRLDVAVLQASVAFELVYNAPDGSVGMWQHEAMDGGDDCTGDDRHLLADDNVSLASCKSTSRHSLTSQAANSSRKA